MKYGLLVNENNQNIGDDIQSYAEAQFLPHVDVMVDREKLDIFKYGKGTEPVALIMGAWFMWKKWHWPPSNQLVPLVVGYHHFNREKNIFKSSSYAVPLTEEIYSGIGGQWFKDYGPIGCRDLYTKEVFDRAGIPSYFSGCVTLTLPKQKKTEDAGEYVVFVDLNKNVEKKIRKIIGNKYKIKVMTHVTLNIKGATWEERVKRVEEYLTIYQNAKYVVTRRLHVALPCLAMEVPVMVIQSQKMNDPNRFEPYKDWLHYCRNNDFLKNGYSDFDFINGTPNKKDYLKVRKEISKTMKEFVEYCEKNKNKKLDFFDKRTYTRQEELEWKESYMRETLDRTHLESRKLYDYIQNQKKKGLLYNVAYLFYHNHIKNKDSKLITKIKKKITKR